DYVSVAESTAGGSSSEYSLQSVPGKAPGRSPAGRRAGVLPNPEARVREGTGGSRGAPDRLGRPGRGVAGPAEGRDAPKVRRIRRGAEADPGFDYTVTPPHPKSSRGR